MVPLQKLLFQSINKQERGARRLEYRLSTNGHPCGTLAKASCDETLGKSKAPFWEKVLK